jgi:hypothetical protein
MKIVKQRDYRRFAGALGLLACPRRGRGFEMFFEIAVKRWPVAGS